VNATCVFEKGISLSNAHVYEEDIAHRWWALPLNINLPLTSGEKCQLIYAGRPGGSYGPDIRDVILSFTTHHPETDHAAANPAAEFIIGDVEIHIRATDWVAHQHHTDMRYNNVVLHIVLMCDNTQPTQRQDGTVIPTCSLNDVFPTTHGYRHTEWPCHHVLAQLHEAERTSLFMLAGMQRFEMKAQVFSEILSNAQPSDIFNMYDVCLIPALAEGLGFGRDRALFRAAGLRLIGATQAIPEPLGRAPKPSPLDTGRLQMLHTLVERWRNRGAWETFRQILLPASTDSACLTPQKDDTSVPTSHNTTPVTTRQLVGLHQLRNIFYGLGTARTDILICNIVLPFAAAVAQQENCPALSTSARDLYNTYPGLSSNQITRSMSKQLLLKSEPKGACQQQGLHYIYAQACREKRCHECLIGKQEV